MTVSLLHLVPTFLYGDFDQSLTNLIYFLVSRRLPDLRVPDQGFHLLPRQCRDQQGQVLLLRQELLGHRSENYFVLYILKEYKVSI